MDIFETLSLSYRQAKAPPSVTVTTERSHFISSLISKILPLLQHLECEF